MTAVKCTQPGCDGTIEDGFCDVCGLAPAPGTVSSVSGPLSSGPAVSGPLSSGPAASGAGSSGAGSSGPGTYGSGGSSTGSGANSGSGRRGSRGTRGSRGSRGRSSRGGIGGGLVEVPAVPARDPATAVLANPQVPENRRYCGHCGQPVGRASGDRPGRTEGFCRNCGTRFSFAPKLVPGELVAGQYEVLGCLAHGGLGWIYLARDHAVNDMWVVLKGLLNTGDADALAAAEVERAALAEVKHPNIVQVYNYVQHTSQDGETAAYIVMEYVGGKSLKQIRLEARAAAGRPAGAGREVGRGRLAGEGAPGEHGAVPLSHALAYMIEILPALQYLHDHGLVYCDFKPDNVIQSEEQLKLIDLGGVRRIDSDGAIYGTVGYQAPEIESDGPSPCSDLYTVGRALAVLTFDFSGYQGEYKYRLPDSVPLLAEQESFARALRKATHPDPDLRFQTAAEMAEQLTGVLREVLATSDGQPRPAFSGVFSPELRAVGTDLSVFSPGGAIPPDPSEHRGARPPVTPRPPLRMGGAVPPSPPAEGTSPSGFSRWANSSNPSALSGHSGHSGSSGPSSPSGPSSLSAPSSHSVTVSPAAMPEAGEVISGLPAPLVDGADPAAGYLATLGSLEPAAQADALRSAVRGEAGVPAAVSASVETRLALARALLLARDNGAAQVVGELAASEAGDWRVAWLEGLLALASKRPADARAAFDVVFDELPGELAPKLGLGFAAEAAGDMAAARRRYQVVWSVDRTYISAAFGLARTCLATGDRAAAVAALASVPDTSSQHAAAQIAAVRLLVSGGDGTSADDLRQADGRLGKLSLDDLRRQQLTVEVLHAALEWVSKPAAHPGAAKSAPSAGPILGCEPNERALRFGLERGYRALASLTPDPARRIQLVDMANEIRPRTWT